jgi:hypothetical protein
MHCWQHPYAEVPTVMNLTRAVIMQGTSQSTHVYVQQEPHFLVWAQRPLPHLKQAGREQCAMHQPQYSLCCHVLTRSPCLSYCYLHIAPSACTNNNVQYLRLLSTNTIHQGHHLQQHVENN